MDKRKKGRVKRIISWIIVGCIVLALALLPSLVSKDEEDSENAVISSDQASYRTIETRILGGGQLESDSSEDVEILSTIRLKSYLVGDGDTVSAGDPIAYVDRVSVMSAIAEVQNTLQELSSEISDAEDSDDTETLSSRTAGTVKAVYAQKGDSVEDVMLENGALAVLSLDDIMAVKLTCSEKLSIADTVSVLLPDGTTADGKVKTYIGDELVVVMEDNDYEIGTEVTVYSEAGTELGASELYVYDAWNVTAYAGTVSSVSVSVGDTVKADQTLLTLSGIGVSAEYQELVDKRQKYEDAMYELFRIYESGVITAPCDGIVSGTDTTADYMLAYEDSTDSGYQLVLLSEASALSIVTETLPGGTVGVLYGAALQAADGTEQADGTWSADTLPAGLSLDSGSGLISGTPTAAGTTTVTVSFRSGSASVTKVLTLTISDAASSGTYLGYPAQVTEVNGNTIRVLQTKQAYSITDLNRLPDITPDTKELTEEADYTDADLQDGDFSVGDLIWVITDEDGRPVKAVKFSDLEQDSEAADEDVPGGDSSRTETPDSSFSGGTISGGISVSGMTGGFGAAAEEDTLYSLDKTSVATVTSQEQMYVTISVDELDISEIYTGMTATLTMNALPGETAEAVVSKIAGSSDNTDGNAKYSVTLELTKSTDMLPGMNATVELVTGTEEQALTVPAAALYEVNGEQVVYTGYNEKTGALTDPKTVTIGSADADYVEILSGLSEGDTVYYETYEASDTISAI